MSRLISGRAPVLLAVVLPALLSPVARADTVTLKSGATFSGLIVETNDQIVTLKRRREAERVFKQAEVASFDFNKEGTEEALLPPPPPPPPPVKVATPVPRPELPPAGVGVRNAKVIIYGTTWCGYCAKARSYLNQQRIPFADVDIERDPQARVEVARKCSAKGIPFDGSVPVLDVNGHMIRGFDVPAIKAALGDRAG